MLDYRALAAGYSRNRITLNGGSPASQLSYGSTDTVSFSLVQFLLNQNRVLTRFPAGSGKSTLMYVLLPSRTRVVTMDRHH